MLDLTPITDQELDQMVLEEYLFGGPMCGSDSGKHRYCVRSPGHTSYHACRASNYEGEMAHDFLKWI